jgi:Tfp pilus assembly protein PilF
LDGDATSKAYPSRLLPWLYACLLVALTAAAYCRVSFFEFVLFDDDFYITNNSVVKQGLSWYGVVWAFTQGYAANWHPLTWLSHMVDTELFGLDPAGPHLVNLGLHIANTLVLFYLVRRMTGFTGRSAFVAALFALHPLHVESVAWVSERKDVLSTLLWFLTTLAYLRFMEKRSVLRYMCVVLLFAAGLMSKPMLVTLPLTLLLLDFWPLKRTASERFSRLLLEKCPLLFMSLLSSLITIWVQRQGGAMEASNAMTAYDRVSNAVVAYCLYLGKTVWPFNLSPIYPRPLESLPVGQVAAACAVLLLFTVIAVLAVRRAPYVLAGWSWYLITLIPVAGFIPIGYMAMADRYTYIPLVGIFVLAVWALCEFSGPVRWQRVATVCGACLLIAALAITTCVQTGIWRTSETLFRHAIRAVPDNAPAHIHLAVTYLHQNRPESAVEHLNEARRIWPKAPEVYSNLGAAYRMMGQVDLAIVEYEKAILLDPEESTTHSNLGVAYMLKGNPGKASVSLEKAVELSPRDVHARYMLAVVKAMQGETLEARKQLESALRLDPENATVRKALESLRRGELVPFGHEDTP